MRHSSGRRHAGAAIRLVLVFLGGLLALGPVSSANAGGGAVTIDPTTFVDTGCLDGQGTITVTVTDGSYPVLYNITIDGTVVAEAVSEGTSTYKPYAAGDYEVVIKYTKQSGVPVVDDDTWTVDDCGGLPPSTTEPPAVQSTTTAAAAPVTAAPTTAAGVGAAAATTVPSGGAAALPATGKASGNLALTALLLTAIGGGLLLIVRQARRA